MSFFEKLKNSLEKTRRGLAFTFGGAPDSEFYDSLEERLILADAGVETAQLIVQLSKQRIDEQKISGEQNAREVVREVVASLMRADEPFELTGSPTVILMIGVNGAGKTTTAGKLAGLWANSGKKVLLAAADTFRAAAIDQLCIWGERSGVQVIRNEQGSDAAAVIFDAVSAGASRGCDVVICDTAGRLHNKKNLMDELSKMARIITKACSTAEVKTLLVLDGVTGQNALSQAAEFATATGVDGIVLTKLDGTARGGCVLAVKHTLGIPVRFIGIGEGMDDLAQFDADEYARALLDI